MSEQFIGPYRLLAILGHGPTTTVYKAWQESIGRPVTLKVVTRPDASVLCRLQAESQLTANLSDPNIRQVYEAGQTPDSQVYVALQFVDYSLKDLMRQRFSPRVRRPFSRAEVADLLKPIADALGNLHKHGLVHLDIKPENILVFKESGRTVLADLGIAQPLGARTRLGTPLYASPEQAAGDRPVGPWCDVYSLGVVAYEMLAGRPPFQSNMDVALLRMHLEEKPPPPRKFRRDIPSDLERVVMQALSKDPRQRFASASAFIESVRRPPTPVTQMLRHTTTLLRRTPQMLVRQPWVLGLVALLVAVPIVAVLGPRFKPAWLIGAPTATPSPAATPPTITPVPVTVPTGTPMVVTSTPRRLTSSVTPPPRTLTPVVTETPAATLYPAPILAQPPSDTIVRAGQGVSLEWSWSRQLGPGERFRVRITGPGEPIVRLTDGPFLSIGQPSGGSGTYQWTVEAVRVDSSGQVVQVLSRTSDPWQITWQ